MKLVVFETESTRRRPGAMLTVDGQQFVLDLVAAFSEQGITPPASIAEVLSPEALSAAAKIVEQVGRDSARATARKSLLPSAGVRLLAPVPEHPFVICTGANYGSHLLEMNVTSLPQHPFAFVKSPHAVTGPGMPIRIPARLPNMVDFEGELCVVFGRRCSNVAAADAMNYVAGYTILNDVSARDGLAGIRVPDTEPVVTVGTMMMGKHFPTFCPLGPVIATPDEIPDWRRMHIVTKLNGKVMQDGYTDDLIFGIPALIEEFSHFYTFEPGDVMSTGSPPGVGMGRKPPVFMKPGDEVAITVHGIGTLHNPIAA
jgi:2-keto-4-pentenoate hydratase/2-oxohepta-3-ene-1,7-dioic acid hydratase in catechol pathway